MDKQFYKMRLCFDEGGFVIVEQEFVSIHETECYHFCISRHCYGYIGHKAKGIELVRLAKEVGHRVYKVDKRGSRIAFDSRESAFDHLKWMQRRRWNHLNRDLELVGEFNSLVDSKSFEEMKLGHKKYDWYTIPNTSQITSKHFNFC
jgi:hypothetical protein